MTSERKIDANRRNAESSTGPRTAEGKARASTNARHHGLAGAHAKIEQWDRVEKLARAIAGDSKNPDVLMCGERIAESLVEIDRIKSARVMLLELYENPGPAPSAGPGDDWSDLSEMLTKMEKLERYESRALSRRRRALCDLRRL